MTTELSTAGDYSQREQVGWYFYDWANSAFATSVVTVFLGPYLTAIATSAADAGGFVHPLGVAIRAGSIFPFAVSISVALQAFVLPVLGAIADYSHLKKQLLGICAYIGAFATVSLFFVQGNQYLLGVALFIIANLSFGASIVFYNAYLPDIASDAERDRVSSQGWALGYLGGGLLLALHLLLYLRADAFGLTEGLAVRIGIASAGLWWALFTIIPMLTLRRRQSLKRLPAGERYLTIGFKQLWHTLKAMPSVPHTLIFLVAYLFYNDGIQTVNSLAAQFGSEELKLGQQTLIGAILLVQFIAFFGALLFGYLARLMSAKRAVILSLVIWTGVVICAYAFVQPGAPWQFFLLGSVIAIVLGGSQALSRSLFSRMIPRGRESEYFSLYEVSERGTSWLGPALYGVAFQLTGSYRVAILSVIVLFLIGLMILTRVDVARAVREAGNEAAAA